MNPSDDLVKPLQSAIFHPYQHQDYYGMDSLFLSPLQSGEVWNLQNVMTIQASILAFLTLRSFLLDEAGEKKLEITGLNRAWKTYLAKTQYFSENSFVHTQHFIPNLVPREPQEVLVSNIIKTENWKKTLRWELYDKSKKFVFFVATGRAEKTSSKNLSDLLSQFLAETQKASRLERAYIRKESSSYLYLQSREQINARVFFRENPTDLPEFLLFIAELESV